MYVIRPGAFTATDCSFTANTAVMFSPDSSPHSYVLAVDAWHRSCESNSIVEGTSDRSGRVVALEGEQGYRALVRSRGTITDSPEHRPHRCLPAAGATTTTTARTAATAVVLDDLARVGAGCEWGRLERRGGGRSQRAGGRAGGRTRISRVSEVARHDHRLTRAPPSSLPAGRRRDDDDDGSNGGDGGGARRPGAGRRRT